MSNLQMEKIKRLYEDYFISLVECGIKIPKDKIDVFKTLFLKHYKQQLMFEGLQENEDEANSNGVNGQTGQAKPGSKKIGTD